MGRLLTDRQARRIAADWHDGGALHALASTGTITADTAPELEACLAEACQRADRRQLRALLAYVRHHGARGKQRGWSSLRW